ncbi:hypothetical protein [Natrinema amylolyticum]|uniref:hypothetical protein n=1 Tax=Natrinema amylolyticum TaxID=2878679 RepID=UPI001CFA4ADF|nr:hypothetical protein [Natrinema amylolyticum]
MRLIRVFVPAAVRDDALRVLDGEGLDCVRTEETSNGSDGGVVSDEMGVTLVVQRPADQPTPYPALVESLETALEDGTDREVTVTVEFVDGATTTDDAVEPS